MNPEFWKGKTVLVTGHTGFKGAWLSLWLTKLGANVVGYALEPYTPKDLFTLSGLQDHMISIIGTICDPEAIQDICTKYQPEIVFHLAAQPFVRLSYTLPKETYEVNVMGTLHVLEAARHTSSVKAAIMITTDKCYENTGQLWGYRETDRFGGHDPYSASKGCTELLIASYRRSFFQPDAATGGHPAGVASARAGNVIGGGDWGQDRIVPDCIRSLEADIPIRIRSPYAIRPWQHVLEPLSGYLLLAERLFDNPAQYSHGWNFGPENNGTATVMDMVRTVIAEYGTGCLEFEPTLNAPHEAERLTLDITKARELLNWKPRLDFKQTVAFTVDWYRRYPNENVYDLCMEQIDTYTKAWEQH